MGLLVPIGIAVGILIALIIFLCCIYRVADVDKALIITGGQEPVIKVSGGGFVIPIFRKASYFDLCMLTVPADGDEIKTITSVPIVVDWTAQIRPNTKDLNVLKKAIVSFKERGNDGIVEDVKLTLMGAVRGVVATMTPEQVQNDKETFKESIMKSVADELDDMGLELVSLNIQDISDRNGYYDNIAALDMEEKRKGAENKKAIIDQEVRIQKANAEREATKSELESELSIAEKKKDNDLRIAAFKIETDKANADAEIAGELQMIVRQKEVAVEEGQVEVTRQEQANLAAMKKKEVMKTEAEAQKIQAEIKAEETANVATINAKARAKVAEEDAAGKAKAAEFEATGNAKAIELEAAGKAKAVELEAAANASKIRLEGETEADIIAKKGAAEAEKERAILLAKAEGEKALAEARAGNDKVNFEIEKLKIEANARVEIATKTATIMAELGKNAEFVNIGGGQVGNGQTGNVLLDTLAGIPGLMKTLDVQNQALNDKPINQEIENLVSSVVGPAKGLLVNKTDDAAGTVNNTIVVPEGKTPSVKSERPNRKPDIDVE